MPDAGWGIHGDIELDGGRGIRITDNFVAEAMKQNIVKRLTTDDLQWSIPFPPTCANLRRFAGEDNSEESAAFVARAIRRSLVRDSIVVERYLDVDVFPVAPDAVMVTIDILAFADTAITIEIMMTFGSGEVLIGEIK